MKKQFVLLSATLLGNVLHAQSLKATHEQSHYEDIKGVLAAQPGYSQPVSAPLQGHIIFLSRQTPWDTTGTITSEGNFKRQLPCCLQTIEKILTAKGAQKSHIVKLNYYVKNLAEGRMYPVTGVAKQVFAYNLYPAGSLLGVAKPADDCFLLEMEATALVVNS